MTTLSNPTAEFAELEPGRHATDRWPRPLARQFGKVVELTCVPFQFAFSTRAGTDSVGHTIRTMTDA